MYSTYKDLGKYNTNITKTSKEWCKSCDSDQFIKSIPGPKCNNYAIRKCSKCGQSPSSISTIN